MDDEKIKARIGSNIASFRKAAGLTQAGLAEKLNYSDKAISKWERGESVPDVLTLMQLGQLFGVTMDALVSSDSPAGAGLQEPERPTARKGIIQALVSTLVWFVALFFFVVISSFRIPGSWVAFVYAIPVNAIVLLSLRSAWHDYRWNKALISTIVWGRLVSIYETDFALLSFNAWQILLLGIPGQVAIFLWFRMFQHPKEEALDAKEEEHHE